MTINFDGFDILKHIIFTIENIRYYDCNFDENNYYIELGISHYNKIINDLTKNSPVLINRDKTSYNSIEGIRVNINYENPHEFKIYKDITMESQVIK